MPPSSSPENPRPTLWLLEDSPTEAEAVRRTLDTLCTVEHFSDGAALLEALTHGEAPEALVLDWHVPGLSGLEVCQYLRSRPDTEALPVLFLTSNQAPEDIAQGLAAGADDFVTKPFRPLELQARVQSLLRAADIRRRHLLDERARRRLAESSLGRVQAAELRARKAEERYRTLFESMDEGFCVMQLLFDEAQRPIDFRYIEVNPAFERQTGMRGATGRTIRELVPGIEQRWCDLYGKVALTGEPMRVENHVASIGRWFDVYAFRTGEPTARQVAAFFNDITLRKEAEARAQAEQRLLNERADFERQLIGIVSHDLRNPLNAILLSAATLLRRPGLDTRQERALRRMQDSAERMTRMVRDLLDFTQARLGTGLTVQRKPLDLHALARQVVDEVMLAHPEREVRVVAEGDAHGAFDSDRIAQVLSNLLTNALTYGAGGSPVRVTTRGEGTSVVLEVHNMGEPIPPELRERIFRPLERGTEANVPSGARSIGLGLFIVASIVRSHSGLIQVSSTAEAGTTFSVVLPRGAQAREGGP